jgi:basic amino acid/polyamine antiporter, APA family
MKNSKNKDVFEIIEKLSNVEIYDDDIRNKLNGIISEKDEASKKDFVKLIKRAFAFDIEGSIDIDDLFFYMSKHLSEVINVDQETLYNLFRHRENESSTALTTFLGIPHIIIDGKNVFYLAIARCREGIRFSSQHPGIKAVFVLIGANDKRDLHIKALASIAKIVQNKDFEKLWINAKNKKELKDLLISLYKTL